MLALLVLLSIGGTSAIQKFGVHSFPKVSPKGFEPTNEFQMLQPEHVKDGRLGLGADTYVIDKISPLVIDNDEVVTVTFATSKPYNTDWIAAYSPSDVDITQTVPVKFGWCDEGQGYLKNGIGSLTFNFTNLRSDIAFYYFINSTAHPIMVSKASDKVTFKNPNQPLRPRIVATGDTNVLNLLWSSANSTKPVLRWGSEVNKLNNVVEASTNSITRDQVCGAPSNTTGWRETGLIHTAPLVGMNAHAGKPVYYVFGDDSTNDFSETHTLHVPPLPGITKNADGTVRPTRAVLYDDLGRGSMDSSYTWNEYGRPAIYTLGAVGAEVDAGLVDVVYHGGDISYATGYLAVWDFFLDELAPVAGSVVYLSTVGNHETDWYNSSSLYSNSDSGGECGVLTTTLLPMPAPATTNKPWWSYDVGMIHFVGMSTEHNYDIGSEQWQWLENDLKSVDRTVTPWVIFGGHRAMYINSNYGGAETSDITVMDRLILNIEPLLFKYRVNVGFYGHNHVVQRHSAVYQKEVVQASEERVVNGNVVHWHENPQATVQMVVGTGGAAYTKNAYEPKPEWNEMYFYEYGYARVEAVNATYLNWEWVESASGEVHDRMVITQVDPTQPWVL